MVIKHIWDNRHNELYYSDIQLYLFISSILRPASAFTSLTAPSSFVQDVSKLPVSVPKPIIDVCVFPCLGCVIHCP